MRAQRFEIGIGHARPVQASAEERRRLTPFGIAADQRRRVGQQIARVGRAAMDRVLPEAMTSLGLQGRDPGELGVGLVVARQHGERDAVRAAGLGDALDTVGPVADAAEQADNDEPRAGDDRVDVDVDRHVVGELQEVGETEARKVVAEARARGGEARELGIGGRQHDDVARRLAEVDGFRSVGDDARLGRQKMHQPAIAASTASRSRPVWPMITSCVARASPGRQSRS